MGRSSRGRVRAWIALVLASALLCAVALLAWPGILIARAWLLDRPSVEPPVSGLATDAGSGAPIPIAETFRVPEDPARAEQELRAVLARAREHGLRVSVAGARHTMGGHTIAPGGIRIDMLPLRWMSIDTEARILHVGAGARWSEIIPFLDARGLSVAVMQSNDDFTVGGSLSVNAHGWQSRAPPIASTVESFHILTADGSVVRASRRENRELFASALGGYGLFGILMDADLRVVENARYETETIVVDCGEYVATLAGRFADAKIEMSYGRLCVTRGEAFLREALLTFFRRSPCTRAEIPMLAAPSVPWLRRALFRSQIGSDAGKALRWSLEKRFGEQLSEEFVSRNGLCYESAEVYAQRNVGRGDVLFEAFVPPERFAEYVERARAIVLGGSVDLLNVTVREVRRDDDTLLRYADRDLLALVFLFEAARSTEGDAHMASTTRELVEAALACGGRYYLPYRTDATRDQFERAYPTAQAWFESKSRFDPNGVFGNRFADTYGPR